MHSTNNEGGLLLPKGFYVYVVINICLYMSYIFYMHLYYISSMSKHVHVDEKNDMVNKYNNNIYYRTIKMKHVMTLVLKIIKKS